MNPEAFVKIPKVLFEYRLPPVAFVTYCYLKSCWNPCKGCFPSRTTIAAACGISNSSVGRAVKLLEREGLVRVTHHFSGRRQRNNSYELPPVSYAPYHKERGENKKNEKDI